MFKSIKKVAARIAAVALAFVLTTTVAYAGGTATTAQGGTGTVSVAHADGIYGINGTITGVPGITINGYSQDGNLGGTGSVSDNGVVFYSHHEPMTGNVVVSYSVPKNTRPGTYTITFAGEVADVNGNMTEFNDSGVITVTEATSGGGSTGGSSGSGSSGVTAPAPVAPTTKSDLTEIQRLIAIANELNKSDYTAESWDVLVAALNKAKSMKTSHAQSVVDAAATELQAAIDGLVKIDYTELLATIKSAEDLMNDTELAQLWNEMLSAMDNANANLKGTSQEEVDAAAATLKEIVAKLNEILNGVESDPTVTEPVDGECGVSFHKLLVILLIVSAGLNVVLGFVIANKSKKRKQDNVPMVKH